MAIFSYCVKNENMHNYPTMKYKIKISATALVILFYLALPKPALPNYTTAAKTLLKAKGKCELVQLNISPEIKALLTPNCSCKITDNNTFAPCDPYTWAAIAAGKRPSVQHKVTSHSKGFTKRYRSLSFHLWVSGAADRAGGMSNKCVDAGTGVLSRSLYIPSPLDMKYLKLAEKLFNTAPQCKEGIPYQLKEKLKELIQSDQKLAKRLAGLI